MSELQRSIQSTRFLEPLMLEIHHGKLQLVKHHREPNPDPHLPPTETVLYGKAIQAREYAQYAFNMLGLTSLGIMTGLMGGAGLAIANALIK